MVKISERNKVVLKSICLAFGLIFYIIGHSLLSINFPNLMGVISAFEIVVFFTWLFSYYYGHKSGYIEATRKFTEEQ